MVIVASESATGLSQAHTLLRQFASGKAGENVRLLGVITVAPVPGKRPVGIRQSRDLLAGLAENLWEVPFVPHLREFATEQLPTWSIGDDPYPKKRPKPVEAVPPQVAEIAADIVSQLRAAARAL